MLEAQLVGTRIERLLLAEAVTPVDRERPRLVGTDIETGRQARARSLGGYVESSQADDAFRVTVVVASTRGCEEREEYEEGDEDC